MRLFSLKVALSQMTVSKNTKFFLDAKSMQTISQISICEKKKSM